MFQKSKIIIHLNFNRKRRWNKKRNKLWREQQCKRVFKARMIYYASFEHDVIDDEGNLIHSPHWFELAKLRCWKVYKTTGTPCSCMICQGERYNRLSYKKETQRIIQKAVG